MDVVYHIVRDIYRQDMFELQLVASKYKLTNIYTKTLTKQQYELLGSVKNNDIHVTILGFIDLVFSLRTLFLYY